MVEAVQVLAQLQCTLNKNDFALIVVDQINWLPIYQTILLLLHQN